MLHIYNTPQRVLRVILHQVGLLKSQRNLVYTPNPEAPKTAFSPSSSSSEVPGIGLTSYISVLLMILRSAMASSFCLSSVHFQVGQLRYIAIYFVLTGTCAHACLAKFRPYKQLAKAEVAHQMASLL